MGKCKTIEMAWFVYTSNNSQRNSILDKAKKIANKDL